MSRARRWRYATTVHDDNAADLLMGGGGLDLYFVSPGDQTPGRRANEAVVEV